MQDFIVLGIVPGTNIQLDFNDLLLLSMSLAITYFLANFVIKHHKVILPLVTGNTNTALIGPIAIDEVTI